MSDQLASAVIETESKEQTTVEETNSVKTDTEVKDKTQNEEKEIENKSEEEETHEIEIPDCEDKVKQSATNPAIMTLEKLPTWAKEGAELIKDQKLEDIEAKYEANTEINEKISFWMRGDSSKLECDAVVNAANSRLSPGGGICGILHGAAGHSMAADCHKIGYTPTGKCAVTLGYKLPAKYCIHTVGPIGEHPEKLQEAYESTLKCIDGEKIRSVGLCCISTGIYGYPIEHATPIALETVRKFLEVPENREKTDRIIFVVFERRDVVVYNKMRHEYFPIATEDKN